MKRTVCGEHKMLNKWKRSYIVTLSLQLDIFLNKCDEVHPGMPF